MIEKEFKGYILSNIKGYEKKHMPINWAMAWRRDDENNLYKMEEAR